MRLFDCDRDASGSIDLPRLLNAEDPERLAALLNHRFDALLLPMAYEITPSHSYDRLARLLASLTIPVVTLGLGIDCDEDLPIDRFHPSVTTLLGLLDRHALVFGVRAETTRRWLAANGFHNAVALGCPSLHLYPSAFLALRSRRVPPADGRIATGGYLLRNEERSRWLCALFEGVDATYILQDELFGAGLLDEDTVIIDDATGSVDPALIAPIIRRSIGRTPPFRRYAYFHSLDAWRLCCAGHDLYVGDRFHGAIVALQVGRPALLFTKDVRARELSQFYGIPTADLEQAAAGGLRDLVAAQLTPTAMERFIDVWSARHGAFLKALGDAGLRFTAASERLLRRSRPFVASDVA